MHVILLIIGIGLVAGAIITPVGAFIKDKIFGRKRKLWGYLIAALVLAVIGVILVVISAPHVFAG